MSHGQRQQTGLQPSLVLPAENPNFKLLTTECCRSIDSAPEAELAGDRQMLGNQNDGKTTSPLMIKRKRRQDWCRWPVCEEFRRTGYCHGITGTSLASETHMESSCLSAHIRPSDKIPITPEGEVRICFDSMGLLEGYQHWNACLPNPAQPTPPVFTTQQWQAALNVFLSSWLKMGTTLPVATDQSRLQNVASSVDRMHLLGGPAYVNSLMPGQLPNHGVLSFNTHSMLNSPYHPSVSINQPLHLNTNSPIEPQQIVNSSPGPFVPLNLNNFTNNPLGTPCLSGFDGGWWNLLFGPQAPALNWNGIHSVPFRMPSGLQQVPNCGLRMDSTWVGLPDMLLPTAPYYNQMAMLNKSTFLSNNPELAHLTSSSAGLPFNPTVPALNQQLSSTVPTDPGLMLGTVLSNSSSVLTSLHDHLYTNTNNVNMNTNLSLLPLADQRQTAVTLTLTE
ncbi:hypothetical protein P879_03859 [Paragonimus westermani]|uniref:Uncharacterized protein n=1 Tax=Paragonimus westermani TaxID=34504 RepID=A0A8T0DSB2_9TREM|nr:hypothetical protein P879_03859 [Paragonimus westermani]